ncbi:MAG: hypothetical protein ACYTGN_14475 [Planctomycetota bacterium]|jgi:hypothetical protein
MRGRTAALILLVAGCGDAAGEFDRALAALGAGDLRGAESLAQRAAARGGPAFEALHDFVRGNVAFARCELADKQASTAEAEPFAFDVAINYAKNARLNWSRAAATRDDWPAARRNVERALIKLEELARKKAAAERKRKKADPDPKPQPRPLPQKKPQPDPQEAPGDQPQLKELSREQVLALIRRLAEKESEKRAVRRDARKERTAGVERDW